MDATQALTLIIIAVILRDGLLGWALINWVIRASTPAAVPGPAPIPVPAPGIPGTGTIPVPVPVPVPSPPKPRFTGITATSFGGAGDSNASAYGGMVYPGFPGVALPYRFTGTRPTVRVFYNGKSVDCTIVDVGPWNINDPYWTAGTRPEAETGTDTSGRSTNLAGIDLTPAAWSALGVSNPDSVKTKVDWDFVSYLDTASPVPAPAPSPPVTQPVGDPPWITLGRTFNGLVWSGGPMPAQAQAWMDNIATKFPEMAPYCKSLKAAGANNWFAWCGFFVQSMLAYSNIRGPISAAGLSGQTTTGDFAYVDAWLTWGTAVTDPQPGDVLIWNAPGIHHVSFYNTPEPDTDTYSSLGGDQGKPLRVCIEDINMDYCVGIRRPPAPSA